jgi:hypothetical protein
MKSHPTDSAFLYKLVVDTLYIGRGRTWPQQFNRGACGTPRFSRTGRSGENFHNCHENSSFDRHNRDDSPDGVTPARLDAEKN